MTRPAVFDAPAGEGAPSPEAPELVPFPRGEASPRIEAWRRAGAEVLLIQEDGAPVGTWVRFDAAGFLTGNATAGLRIPDFLGDVIDATAGMYRKPWWLVRAPPWRVVLEWPEALTGRASLGTDLGGGAIAVFRASLVDLAGSPRWRIVQAAPDAGGGWRGVKDWPVVDGRAGLRADGRPRLPLPTGGTAAVLTGWFVRDLSLEAASRDCPVHEEPFAYFLDLEPLVDALKSSGVLVAAVGVLTVIGISDQRATAPARPVKAPNVAPAAREAPGALCDEANPRFVRALRCEIASLAAGTLPPGDARRSAEDCPPPEDRCAWTFPGDPACGPDVNAQPSWCGLVDRADDAWSGNFGPGTAYDFADLAASQACFEVLGQPSTYAQDGQPGWADPTRMLEADPVASLVGTVRSLRAACDAWRPAVQEVVTGAALGTVAGRAGDDDDALRASVRAQAGTGRYAPCFRAGFDGTVSPTALSGECARGPASAPEAPPSAWDRLGGSAGGPDLVGRYVATRFAGLDPARSPSADAALWSCWEQATGARPPATSTVAAAWGFEVPRVPKFDPRGLFTSSQLELDSALAAVDAGQSLDACWSLVHARLPAWQPAYVDAMAERPWPAPDQQVCAEACLDAFALVGERSLTPRGDLARCTGPGPAPLTLPWNGGAQASAAEVCAFHLLAQERVVDPEVPLPMEGGAQVWAGDAGEGRAGATNGLATIATLALDVRAGRAECAATALQCFHGVALEQRFAKRGAPLSSWEQRWESALRSLTTRTAGALAVEAPWCAPIAPWLLADAPEAQIDAPCRVGVEEARDTVAALFTRARGAP